MASFILTPIGGFGKVGRQTNETFDQGSRMPFIGNVVSCSFTA
jgi:hypothetical protein